jgi:hypothetical protein
LKWISVRDQQVAARLARRFQAADQPGHPRRDGPNAFDTPVFVRSVFGVVSPDLLVVAVRLAFPLSEFAFAQLLDQPHRCTQHVGRDLSGLTRAKQIGRQNQINAVSLGAIPANRLDHLFAASRG